jgi:hypothetical protein
MHRCFPFLLHHHFLYNSIKKRELWSKQWVVLPFYDARVNKWKFFTSVYDVVYEIDLNEGIDLIQKLKDFSRYKL